MWEFGNLSTFIWLFGAERCEWISQVFLLRLIIIQHVGDILIRDTKVNIWLLMFCEEHEGFA